MVFREGLWVSEHTLKVVHTSPKTRACKKRQAGEVKGLENTKEIEIGKWAHEGDLEIRSFSLVPKEGLLLILDQAKGACDRFALEPDSWLSWWKSPVSSEEYWRERVRKRAETWASFHWIEHQQLCWGISSKPGDWLCCVGSHEVFQDKRARSTNISHPLPKEWIFLWEPHRFRLVCDCQVSVLSLSHRTTSKAELFSREAGYLEGRETSAWYSIPIATPPQPLLGVDTKARALHGEHSATVPPDWRKMPAVKIAIMRQTFTQAS